MGGGEGAAGRAVLLAEGGGEPVDLGGCFVRTFEAGDRLVLETPGGGGFGAGEASG